MSDATPNPAHDVAYTLGKIESSTTDIAENVRALRIDMSNLATRLASTEKAVAEIQAERGIMMPDYLQFVHKVRNHMQVATAVATSAAKLAETVEHLVAEVAALKTWQTDSTSSRKVLGKYTTAVWSVVSLVAIVAASFVTYYLSEARNDKRQQQLIQIQQSQRDSRQDSRDTRQNSRDAQQDTRQDTQQQR